MVVMMFVKVLMVMVMVIPGFVLFLENSVITVVVLSQSLNTLIAFDLGKRLSAALPRSLCEVCFLCHLMFGGWWGWLLSLFFCSQLTFYHRRHSSSAVNVSDGEGL